LLRLPAVSVVLLLACGPAEETTAPVQEPLELRTADSGCFHYPMTDFNTHNYAETEISIASGDRAAEFELRDLEGATYTLSGLLAEKPVLLVLGSFT
jgi:hypothetical protein